MRRWFQKLTAFTLALVIFYNASGFVITFLSQQAFHREVVAELLLLKKAPLVLLRFTKAEAAKYLAGDADEFRYENGLYDVAEVENTEDGVNVYCYQDTNENNLIHHFLGLLKNNSNSHKNKTNKIQQLNFWEGATAECPVASCTGIPSEVKRDVKVLRGQTKPGMPVKPPEYC